MNVLMNLLDIYQTAGYQVSVGVCPHHTDCNAFSHFATLFRGGQVLPTGLGLSVQELYLLETLFEDWHPRRIFVVGNAFGWSSLALALLNPGNWYDCWKGSSVVALDNCSEKEWARQGLELTNRLAEQHNLNVRVVYGTSPQEVGQIVREQLGAVDLALIDGHHSNEQIWLDWQAIRAVASPDCVYLFHDVLNLGMVEGFRRIAEEAKDRVARLLTRTPSGMGVLSPVSLEGQIGERLGAFVDPFVVVKGFKNHLPAAPAM